MNRKYLSIFSIRSTTFKPKFLLCIFYFLVTITIFCKDPDDIGNKAGSKTLIAKNLKLIVWDDNGRFNLYSNNDNRWDPIFFDDFPSTNFIRFYINNEVLDFGMGGGKNKSSISIVDDSVAYIWSNSDVKITLNYSFIKIDSDLYDTLRLNINVENLTSKLMNITGFFCFDTYLGENKDSHFILPGDIAINTETEFLGNTVPSFISAYSNKESDRIKFYFDGNPENRPYRVFMANWKKVSERQGVYNVKGGEPFNWGRFSFNDSALFIEYRDLKIDIDSYISRDIFVQNKNNNVVVPIIIEDNKKTETNEILVQVVDDKKEDFSKNDNDELDLNNLSIDELLKLLNQINKKLDNSSLINQSDIDYADKIINAIQSKKK